MKKTYRISQLKDVLGRQVTGLELCELGLPYGGATGGFIPENQDRMDMMFALVARYPELHIVSQMYETGYLLNRYEEGAWYYLLYRGNADPEIEFSDEYDPDDYSPEERQRWEDFLEDFRNTPWSPTQVAGVNWAIDRMIRKK